MQTSFNVTDYGAIGDGNPANAATNLAAFRDAQAAIAASGYPGTLFVPASSKGFVLPAGQFVISSPDIIIQGESSMGCSGPPSIISLGSGHTLAVSGSGCTVANLSFSCVNPGDQNVNDSYLYVTGTQVSIRDINMTNPNIGISLQLPELADGEFWIKEVLIGGNVKVAGISARIGNAAICMNHVIMYGSGTQPPYGVVITSAGEVIMCGGCDIIQMGTCLALVPGLNGIPNQWVEAVFVSDCLFDSGDGQGCVYICPHGNAHVEMVRFTNVWTSTYNNGGSTWPTNGYTFDGSQATPQAGLRPIQDVTMVNCVGRSFVRHCGVYAKMVHALAIDNCTLTGSFNGIQLSSGCTDFSLTNNKCGDYSPAPGAIVPGVPLGGGNAAYGIEIEPGSNGIIMGNKLHGNGLGGLNLLQPTSVNLLLVGFNLV